jgi:hypothetical protein
MSAGRLDEGGVVTGPLYGRAVEPRLIRQLLIRPEHGNCPQPPTLVLEGGAATGKTVLLGEIARGWIGKVPCSYLDVAAVEGELGEEAIPELLAAIASQLARRCRLYGSLRFDRLVIGLQAMRLDLSDVDPRLARAQVSTMLKKRRGLGTFKRVLGDVAQEALELVPGPFRTPPSLIRLVLDAIVDVLFWLISRNALGRARNWYGHQDRGLGLDPIGQLVDLNWARRHPARADARSEVNELLCDAFLADLRCNFHAGMRSTEWALNCLVLLDNIDCRLGQAFLRQLTALRDPGEGADLDLSSPLVVVGGSRGGLVAGMTQVERAMVVELTNTRDLTRPGGQRPAWGRRLPPLSHDDVRKMATTAIAAYRQNNLVGMLHHLTGGHPGGLAFLLKVIMDVRPENVEPEALLVLPYHGDTVGGILSARLLVGVVPDDIDVLVTCSAARDRREGLRLLGRAVNRDIPAALLPVDTWDPAGEVPTTLLRMLLLRMLARRSGGHPWNWARAHAVLRATVRPSGEPDLVGELHHTLAMGEVEPVLDVLAGRLGTEPLAAWLGLLQAVATAPAQSERPDPPTGNWPPFLPLLLTRLWRASDPLLGSDRSGLYDRIAGGLNDLATHLDDTCDELVDLVAHYQNLARQWRRGPRRSAE